jgi:hypothetical protein
VLVAAALVVTTVALAIPVLAPRPAGERPGYPSILDRPYAVSVAGLLVAIGAALAVWVAGPQVRSSHRGR